MAAKQKEGFSVFPINNQAYRKRRKAFVACSQCKRARRRCVPDERGSRSCQFCQTHSMACSLNADANILESPPVTSARGETILPAKRPREREECVFIASLDPKSDLLASGDPDRDHVGVWISVRDGEGGLGFERPRELPNLDKNLWNHLMAVGAFELPRKEERDALVKIYLDFIHPICPLLHRKDFEEDYAANASPLPLLHAILMVAARDVRAASILARLQISPREFAAQCETKIQALLYADIEKNCVHLARVHCLLFFHSEGPEGFLKAAKHLSVSFHYAYSVAIHLRKSPGTSQEVTSSLWWTMWCFDRLSSCMNGGPLNSNAKDRTVTLDEFPPLGLDAKRFVEACTILDATIELYRPLSGVKTVPEAVLSTLANPTKCNGSPCSALVRLIEIMAVILAYKQAIITETIPPPRTTLIPLCFEVYEIVEEYSSIVPPLPTMPYIVSLTFTVFLKFWDKSDMRFGVEWRRGISILDTMSERWWAAEAMSSMATKALAKLESSPSIVATPVAEKLAGEYQSASVMDGAKFVGQNSDTRNEPSNRRPGNEDLRVPVLQDDFYLDDVLFGRHDDASFFAQSELLGELDQGVVDFWFPNM